MLAVPWHSKNAPYRIGFSVETDSQRNPVYMPRTLRVYWNARGGATISGMRIDSWTLLCRTFPLNLCASAILPHIVLLSAFMPRVVQCCSEQPSETDHSLVRNNERVQDHGGLGPWWLATSLDHALTSFLEHASLWRLFLKV